MMFLAVILSLFLTQASTVSIMTRSVENERIAGERRMDALFAKKIDVLCPGFSQKGMSLCVRQYIKNYKIETATGYAALSTFIAIAANQDRNAKIYDATTAQILAMETLVLLQEQLKKENMICGTLKPSGPQNLLEIKQVCAQEEVQFRKLQEKNKKYIEKKLAEIIATKGNEKNQKWIDAKKAEIYVSSRKAFHKTFFDEAEYKITENDIVEQHKQTLKTSCEKLEPKYKNRFSTQNTCEQTFSRLMLSCVEISSPRDPASIKNKEMMEMVQKPLPCFYNKMQQYLSTEEASTTPN